MPHPPTRRWDVVYRSVLCFSLSQHVMKDEIDNIVEQLKPSSFVFNAYLVSGGDVGGAPRGGTRPTFDPGDADHFAAAASPVLRGMPAGQRN